MKSLLLLLLMGPLLLPAQQPVLSLAKAYELATQNYPLIKQKQLLTQTSNINIDNLSKGFLPQFSVSGQATYQSDVTQVNIPIPGVSINPASKDQYKIIADINQLIYDGGAIASQKSIQQFNDNTEQEKIAIELYKLKERINQLFLGVLFLDAQLKQLNLVKEDLGNGINRTEAQVNNGVAFRSNLNTLKAELLKAEQREIELQSSRKGLTDVLGLFINQPLPANVQLEKPVVATAVTPGIQRPELKFYSMQEQLLDGQYKLIGSRLKPRASIFLQTGYGRPGLNFLKNEFAFFYTTGIRLNWNFGEWYTKKNDRQLVDINKRSVEVQRETFLLNTNAALQQQQAEMDKLLQLIEKDNAIIELRVKVKDAAKAQLENSVITANDYLREVNAEDQARQSLITHQVQLLQAQINYQAISGKQ